MKADFFARVAKVVELDFVVAPTTGGVIDRALKFCSRSVIRRGETTTERLETAAIATALPVIVRMEERRDILVFMVKELYAVERQLHFIFWAGKSDGRKFEGFVRTYRSA